MIRDELSKEGYEMWLPPLGGPGVMTHSHKPELFMKRQVLNNKAV
jgi:hypothetical protein